MKTNRHATPKKNHKTAKRAGVPMRADAVPIQNPPKNRHVPIETKNLCEACRLPLSIERHGGTAHGTT